MKSFCLFVLCIVGLANAATQPGPVYRSVASLTSQPSATNPEPASSVGISSFQPNAEARESANFQVAESKTTSAAPTSGTTGSTSNIVGTSSTLPQQSATIPPQYYYYQQPIAPQPQYSYTQAPQPQAQVYGVSFWDKYRMNEVLIGSAAVGLVALGTYMVAPKLMSVRGRALRELSQLDSEDLSRMAKSVFQAIDKVYEMRNAKD